MKKLMKSSKNEWRKNPDYKQNVKWFNPKINTINISRIYPINGIELYVTTWILQGYLIVIKNPGNKICEFTNISVGVY